MGLRRQEAARRPRSLRVALHLLPLVAMLAFVQVAAARSFAAQSPRLAASVMTAAGEPIARSVGLPIHIDGRAAARFAAAHPRVGEARPRLRIDLGARPEATRSMDSALDLPVSGNASPSAVGVAAVSQPTPVITESFAGIRESACGCEPPDPWVAASPTHVVQSTNGAIRVSDRSGKLVLAEPTWALFAVPPDRTDTDPRILWDGIHGRWVGVVATFTDDFSANGLQLAVSDTADPTGAWNVWTIDFGIYLPDYPGISSSSTRIVLTSNDYQNGATYAGPTFLVMDWTNILDGTDLFVGGISYSSTSFGHFRPAIMLSTASNTPVIYEDGVNPAYFEIAGTAHAVSAVNGVDLVGAFGIAPFTAPPAPVQPGAAAIADAADERPTNAVFRNGAIWFVATADYFDGANHWDRSRWTRVNAAGNGSAPTSAVDRFARLTGQHVFMPGIGLNANGSVFLVATRTNPTSVFPTTVLGGIMAGSGIVSPLADVETSAAAYTGTRWGDYVGVASDPSGNGAVWIGHELVASDGSWRTTVVRAVSDGTAPSAPGPIAQALVAPQTLTDAVSVRTSWGAATDADSGVRGYLVEVSTDGGPFVGHETPGTSLVQQLLIGHSYRYRVSAVDELGLVGPAITGPLYTPTLYQSLSSTTGTWSTQTNVAYSGGSTRYASAAGASGTFTATNARAIAIVTTRALTRGSFKVYVDGVLKTTISAYGSPTIYRRILYQVAFPTAGTHSVKIVISGTAGHPRVDADAFVVLR